jgi:hypothetical protein
MRINGAPNIIDIEASGFGSTSYPIEIGVALNSGEKYCTLIIPEKDWIHWDKNAEKVHNISRELLYTHGISVKEAARELNKLLDGRILYSDGWVVDKPWLTTLFFAARMSMKFSVSPIELILSEPQMAIWHETKDRILKQSKLNRHRASNDAWVIQETFMQTKP